MFALQILCHMSSSQYVSARNIKQFIFPICLFLLQILRHLSVNYISVTNISQFLCYSMFLLQILRHISSSERTVLFCYRYYAICHPLSVQYRCTWNRARVMILITWGISAALALPTVFMTVSIKAHIIPERIVIHLVYYVG